MSLVIPQAEMLGIEEDYRKALDESRYADAIDIANQIYKVDEERAWELLAEMEWEHLPSSLQVALKEYWNESECGYVRV